MKKIIVLITLLSLSLFADLSNEYPTKKLLHSGIPIIDVRTPPEWKETGILQNAIPIMFFDQRGNYDARSFLQKLNAKIDTTKPFALICHTGSRTSMIAPWLSKEFGYKVINLLGGMEYVTHTLKVKTLPYK